VSAQVAGGGRHRILSYAIKDKQQLHASYMPFIANGGLFIPTNRRYQLGEELFLLLQLLDEADRIPVVGKVVWVTPPGAEGNRQVGIGIQFSEQDKGNVRRKIESYLAGELDSERPTHTM
jgi:type IV pilus assembly protein PilZ